MLGGFGVARSGDKVRLLREADPVPKVTLRNGSSAKSKHPGEGDVVTSRESRMLVRH